MEIIIEHWLSFAVGIFLLAMVLYGHYRGFLRMAVTLLAVVLSIVTVRVAVPYVSDYLKENTQIRQAVAQAVRNAAGIPEETADVPLPAQQIQLIEEMNLPEQMKQILIENNNSEVYRLLGVDTFLDYVGNYLADMAVRAVGSVILFLIVYLLLRLVIYWLDLLARLPILSGMNQIAGAVLGGFRALLWLWAACLVVDIFSSAAWASAVLDQIQGSIWLTFLYQNNLINWLFMSLLRGLL